MEKQRKQFLPTGGWYKLWLYSKSWEWKEQSVLFLCSVCLPCFWIQNIAYASQINMWLMRNSYISLMWWKLATLTGSYHPYATSPWCQIICGSSLAKDTMAHVTRLIISIWIYKQYSLRFVTLYWASVCHSFSLTVIAMRYYGILDTAQQTLIRTFLKPASVLAFMWMLLWQVPPT